MLQSHYIPFDTNLDIANRLPYFSVIMHTSQQVNEVKIVRRASRRQRIIAGIVFLVLAAFFALLHLAATGRINLGVLLDPCGFKQRYGLTCPTCGITTSAIYFVQGRIGEAFYIQPAGGFLCSILTVSAFLAFIVAVFGVYFRFLERFFAQIKAKYVILALIIILAAGWAVTLARAIAEAR